MKSTKQMKNSLEKLKSRYKIAEERINEPENLSIEIIQSEVQKENRKMNSLRDL